MKLYIFLKIEYPLTTLITNVVMVNWETKYHQLKALVAKVPKFSCHGQNKSNVLHHLHSGHVRWHNDWPEWTIMWELCRVDIRLTALMWHDGHLIYYITLLFTSRNCSLLSPLGYLNKTRFYIPQSINLWTKRDFIHCKVIIHK